MSKIAIIKIGWEEFALPPKVDAAKILQALSQAEHVKSRGYGKDEVWFPVTANDSSRATMTLQYVDSRKMRPRDPGDKEDESGPLCLNA